jgi:2-haloacid dehalogenase
MVSMVKGGPPARRDGPPKVSADCPVGAVDTGGSMSQDRDDAGIRVGYSPSGVVPSYQTPPGPDIDGGPTGVTTTFHDKGFEALTFDCYGTLIDWEAGLVGAFAPILAAHGLEADDEDVLARYARHEARAEAAPYMSYREVLAAGLLGVADELGFAPSDEEIAAFSGSVVDWPAFDDSAAALSRLHGRYRLGVITNCDDDLFAASNARLGVAFDWIVTAQQVGAYKPSEANFHVALERMGLPRERILHVAQSLYHDHVPAKRLGLTTAWIDRRRGRPGSGATPPAEATPDATFEDMASFAGAMTSGPEPSRT